MNEPSVKPKFSKLKSFSIHYDKSAYGGLDSNKSFYPFHKYNHQGHYNCLYKNKDNFAVAHKKKRCHAFTNVTTTITKATRPKVSADTQDEGSSEDESGSYTW